MLSSAAVLRTDFIICYLFPINEQMMEEQNLSQEKVNLSHLSLLTTNVC